MATRSLGQLTIDIIARIGGFEQGMTKAERAAEKSMRRVRGETQKSQQAFASLEKSVASLKGALATLGVGFAIRQITTIDDTYARIEGRLKIVTDSSEELASVQEALFQSAQRTGVAYEDVAELYTRVAQNTKELGLSQKELIAFTETTSQAFQVSGASAAESSGAIRQLTQALASGVLRGQEFNSIAEQGPRILQALADSLGRTRGELRQMAEEGRLTAQVVIDAMRGQASAIDEEFQNLPITVSRALTELTNSFNKAIAGTDTGPLVDSIRELTETISDPQIVEGLSRFAGGLLDLAGAAAEATSSIAELIVENAELVAAYTSSSNQAALDRYVAGLSSLRGLAQIGDTLADIGTAIAGANSLSAGSPLVALVDERFRQLNLSLRDTQEVVDGVGAAVAPVFAQLDGIVNGPLGELPLVLRQAGNGFVELGDGAGTALIPTAALSKEAEAFKKSLEAQIATFGLVSNAAKVRAQIELGAYGQLDEAQRKNLIQLAETLDAKQAAAKASEEAAAKAKAEADALKQATAETDRLRRVYELMQTGRSRSEAEFIAQFERADEVTREVLALTRAIQGADDAQKAAADSAKAALDEIARASEASAEQMRRAYERSAEAIEGVFRDLYRSAFDGFEGFEESLKSSFENLLVEMALIATRNAIIIPVVTSAGGALGLPQQAISGITDALGLGDSGLGNIFGVGGGVAFGQTAATAILNSAYDFADITGAEWAYSLADTLGDPNTFAGLTTVLNNIPGLLAAGTALFSAGSGLAVPNSRVSPGLQGLGAVLAPAFSLPLTVLDNITGGGLFGTSWSTVGQELAISITDQIADATLQTLRERERSLWRGTRRRTVEDPARDLDRQLSESFGLIYDSIADGAERIGYAAGSFSFSFNESIAGLTEEQVSDVINGAITEATEALIRASIPGIDRFRAAGEELTQTFQRLVGGVTVVQDAIDMFDLNTTIVQTVRFALPIMDEFGNRIYSLTTYTQATSGQLLNVANALTELAGGAQQLQTNIANFWDDFASDEQKVQRTAELTNQLFDSLGLTLPETREGVFALVQGLDIFSESGREAFNAITASSDLLDAYFDNLERGAEGALDASEQLRAELERQNFNRSLYLGIERMGLSGEALAQFDLRQEFEAMILEAQRVGGDLAAVEEYYGLRRLAISEQFLQEELSLREQTFGRAIDDLRRFQDELRFGDLAALTPEQQYAAQRQRFNETSALAALGDEEALANLANVGRAFLEASRANFASSSAYFNDLARVNSAVGSGIDAAQFEIDVGQQQLDALNQQIAQGTQMQEVVHAAAKSVEQLVAKQEQDREVQQEMLTETRAMARSTIEANKQNTARIGRIEAAVAELATEARLSRGKPRQIK